MRGRTRRKEGNSRARLRGERWATGLRITSCLTSAKNWKPPECTSLHAYLARGIPRVRFVCARLFAYVPHTRRRNFRDNSNSQEQLYARIMRLRFTRVYIHRSIYFVMFEPPPLSPSRDLFHHHDFRDSLFVSPAKSR